MRRKNNFLTGWMILLLQGICFQVFAQMQHNLDSLLFGLKSLPDDTAKVRTYRRISEDTATRKHFDLAKQYADSM